MNSRWFPLRYHPVQAAYCACAARFIAVIAGRRSGKTELARRRLVLTLPVDRGYGPIVHQYRAAAPTIGHARDLWWADFKALIPQHWIVDLNETRMEIETHVGGVRAKLRVIGLEKALRSEGGAFDGIIIDESSDVAPDRLTSIYAALGDRHGWMIRQGIPKRFGVGAVDYREFCEKGFAGDDPEHAAFTWPSSDILTPDEMKVQQALYTDDDFNEHFGGKWVNRGAGAFNAFDPAVHIRSCAYRPDKPILVGADWNVSPMGWALCHSPDGKTLEVFDELFLNDTWTQQALDRLWDRYSNHKGGWMWYGDATSKSRNTRASDSDYAQVLNDKRFKARCDIPDSNPAAKDRLASCNAILRNAAGEVRCWVDPKCVHLLDDLKKRLLDEKGNPAEGKPGNPIGHVSDGWGYLVHRKWPSTIIAPTGKAGVIIDYGD